MYSPSGVFFAAIGILSPLDPTGFRHLASELDKKENSVHESNSRLQFPDKAACTGTPKEPMRQLWNVDIRFGQGWPG